MTHVRLGKRRTVFYLANGTKVLYIISMLLHKTLHTCVLPDAVLRQGFRIVSDVEYLGIAMVVQLVQ